MLNFFFLLNQLYFTHATNEKINLLLDYLKNAPDPDRGYAIALITGQLEFEVFKKSLIKNLIMGKVDQHLFASCYDYVGELAETVALLWPPGSSAFSFDKNVALSEVITILQQMNKHDLKNYLINMLNSLTSEQRWAFIKLCTHNLRIGVSERLMKKTLALYGNKSQGEVEEVWHAVSQPYLDLFAWLEGRGCKPNVEGKAVFYPVMLSHPLSENESHLITPDIFFAEWKFDGIRIQINSQKGEKGIFSRTGENIGQSFPDLLDKVNFYGVFDGELLVMNNNEIASFNDLQQRLNRKKPSSKLMKEYTPVVMLYDILHDGNRDYRAEPFHVRRAALEGWFHFYHPDNFLLSEGIYFSTVEELNNKRGIISKELPYIEGIMLKHKESQYEAGRPKGKWYKWKRNPYTIDAIMMYAQRGHGKRSSFYSDYTFGLWKDASILPVGKAYSGFTHQELNQLDKWVRKNTVTQYGPVREVKKELVLEISFEGVQKSTRHKSGYALRFPRINRIRWDKGAQDADLLSSLEELVTT